MIEIKQKIEQEITAIHNVFVDWFTGALNKEDLKKELNSRFYEGTRFITTQGESVSYNDLMMMFENGYGKMGSDFKIVISDVELLHEIGAYYLMNYVEWQTTDPDPKTSGNYSVRKTTVLISKKMPFKWLHIQETMMPKPNTIIKDWRS